MQKKLIALAVAGLVSGGAFAQSNVTMSGGIFMGYDSNKTSGSAGTAGFGTVNRVTDHSSNLNINGSEDLGGGMKAVFQIDTRFGLDQTGGTWAGGNSWVGLSGNWGRVVAGKQDLHYNELAGGLGAMRVRSLQSLLGHGIMSEVNGVAITPRTRSNNAVVYNSPNMSGFAVQVAGSTHAGTNAAGTSSAEGGQAADGSKGSAWNLTAKYANGPINAGYSYWQNNEEGGNGSAANSMTDQRSNRIWGRYAFPMGLSLGLGWDSSKYDNDATANTNWVKRNAWQATGQYTMGANAFYLQYAKAGKTSGAGAADDSSGAKAWMLGYDYALSKRTNVGISYTEVKNENGGTYDFFASPVATPVGAKSAQWHLGMSHSF
jgi:predicted porin